MKLKNGMAQIPLHAKFNTCPWKDGDFKTVVPNISELDMIVTENMKIFPNVHPPMSDSGTLDVHVIGHEVDFAFVVD